MSNTNQQTNEDVDTSKMTLDELIAYYKNQTKKTNPNGSGGSGGSGGSNNDDGFSDPPCLERSWPDGYNPEER